MPQPSYAYACARLSALNKRLIEPQTIQRMLDGTASDAMRALSDVRYGSLSDATEADVERMIEREMTDAMQEVRELSPNPAITDLYLLRADVQNLKVLIKARLLNQSETVFTPGGLYDRETLTAYVKDKQYGALPEILRDALNELEKRLEIRVEPQKISVALDRAYLAHALKQSEKHPVFSQYFRAMADFDNVLTFLRLRATGASIETLDEVILPEKQIAEWAAIRYASNHILDYIRIDDGHAIFEVAVPWDWVGKTVGQIDIRRKYGINIMAVKENGKMELSITPDTVLNSKQSMLVLGEQKAIQKCFRI